MHQIKILGVWILQNNWIQGNLAWNFNTILDMIKKTCDSWCHRTLSLKGKVTVINALLISLLQYPCSSIYIPPQVYKEYRKIVSRFIWNSKIAKIAYNTLILPISWFYRGGLNPMDLETRVQSSLLQCPKRLVNFPQSITGYTLSLTFSQRIQS